MFRSIVFLAALSFVPQVAAEGMITAYSAAVDEVVGVQILDVEQTRMSDQNFCTLMTGSYCSSISVEWQAVPQPLLPTPTN